MMNEDKWITVDPKSNKLKIRFRVKGFEKQFYIPTGLEDDEKGKNRAKVRVKRDLIMNDIALENFDSSLQRYQFNPNKNSKPIPVEKVLPKYELELDKLWEKFTEFKSTQIEQTTILGTYTSVGRYINKLPTRKLDNAATIRNWLVKNSPKTTTWILINHFSSCCQWAVESKLIPDNPFLKLKIKKPKKSSIDNNDRRAFTLEQRDVIIQAFENHPCHSHYASLIKFLFFTGARHGEAFALTWGDISEDCTRILINKSCNRHRILKGTKNGKERVFPCKQGSKLQELLLSIRPANYKPTDLVFRTKAGKKFVGQYLINAWNGEACKHLGVVKELVRDRKIPYYLKPYAMRHTFVTWALASDEVTAIEVARWIGDELSTVQKYYAHPSVIESECPDF